MAKVYAGVGSRETPEDILELMSELGKALCEDGWILSSGDAIGADRAFYEGARRASNFSEAMVRIYLSRNGFWNGHEAVYVGSKPGLLDATTFTDTYEQAKQMALEARGSFERLSPGGIALHTRNVFQIHGHTLQDKVKALVYWGIPKGKGEKVHGGTNTALQLAIKSGIEKRINLYYEENVAAARAYLAKRAA